MEIKAPDPIPPHLAKVFLAGSIEMGAAVNWQKRAAEMFDGKGWVVLNPRRDDWDSTWEQSKDNPKFREQVEWELAALDQADAIIINFEPGTKSPISLLELGLHADSEKVWVVCPKEFWRKGNVDIVCGKYDIPQFPTVEDACASIIQHGENN